jgi:hypothetical protein
MPRLPALRTRVLADLARQLRFGSAEAARRQLERAEGLLEELLRDEGSPDRPESYPEEWVVFRVTGLRPETDAAGGGPALVVRGALVADLAALIDRLSAAAGITRAPPGWVGADELCARWGVSRATLGRLRRLGLAGRRITLGGGRQRQAFGPGSVALFERVHAERLRAAGAFTRMDDLTRAAIVRRARRYHARLGWSLDRCARRLAARYGRSVEGVRGVLIRAEGEEGALGWRGPLRAEDGARLERAAVRGVNVSAAARGAGKSRAAVYRAVLARRVERLRGLDLEGPESPTFARSDAASVLLAHPAACAGLGMSGARSVGELVRMAAAVEAEGAGAEAARAGAYGYLLWSARQAVGGLVGNARAARVRDGVDVVETRLLWASRLKAEMVRAQLGLLVRTVEDRAGGPVSALPGPAARGLCAAALAALVEGVDRFDPFKGGRLAAPAGLAVGKAVARWLKEHGPVPVRSPGSGTMGAGAGRAAPKVDLDALALEDWTAAVHPWQEWLELPPAARERLGTLGERERRVIELRYGLAGGPPRTLVEVAGVLGTTPTRVGAMQRRGVALARFGSLPRAAGARRGAA